MAKQISKVWLANFTEAWYQLSPDEQNSLGQKVNEALSQVGGKRVVLCDSSWSSEQWRGFGVEVFPDVEAVQKFSELLNQFNWFRYVESITVIGTDPASP